MRGIEPPSPPYKSGILTIKLHERNTINISVYNINLLLNKKIFR